MTEELNEIYRHFGMIKTPEEFLLLGEYIEGKHYYDTEYRVFFSEDNPQLKAFEALQNTYTKTDNVMFVLAPKNGQVFTLETLTSVARLTEESWQIPYSLRVDSITNYQHTEADGDDLLVDDLVPDDEIDELNDAALQRISNIALNAFYGCRADDGPHIFAELDGLGDLCDPVP